MKLNPSRPLVSVIVPAFQHESFVRSCLESIEAQSYKSIELIVIDDASKDATYSCIQSFVRRLGKRFARTISKRNNANRGAHFSLNRGLQLATGEYISFINSDDMYAPSRLDALVDAMRSKKSEFAFSLVRTIDEKGGAYTEEPLCHHIAMRPLIANKRFPSLSWGLLWRQLTASTGNIVVSSRAARAIGPFTDLKYCHDWDYVLRATFHTEPVLVEEELYDYRVHGANSFKQLSDHAEPDTERVIRSHFRRVMAGRPANPLCAAPMNWPALFEPLVEEIGMKHHLDAVYDPYRDYHKTVDRGALTNRDTFGY